MSILRVANVQFNASGTRRIDYDATADDGIIKISADAIKLPVGDNASRPASQAGMIRYNSDTGYVEFGGATSWIPVASNAAFNVANAAFASANNVAPQVTPAFLTANLAYTTTNAAYGFANAAYASINSNWTVTNTVYGVANTALQNTSGVSFNGNFYVPSGNVGIGTNSPSYKLDVAGKGRIGFEVSQGNPNSTDITTNAHTLLSGTGGNLLAIGQYGAGNSYAQWIQSTFVNPSTATYNLILNPLGGNVGIGTASPTGRLDVASRGITKGSMPAGSILQVQQTVLSSTFTTAATSYTDLTGMSVSITPTSTTSRILVTVSLCFIGDASTQGYCRLVRDSTPIAVGDVAGSRIQFTLNNYVLQQNEVRTSSIMFLDSPATTSATTYKLQLRNQGGGTVYVNRSVAWAADATSGAGISTITVMEIAQ